MKPRVAAVAVAAAAARLLGHDHILLAREALRVLAHMLERALRCAPPDLDHVEHLCVLPQRLAQLHRLRRLERLVALLPVGLRVDARRMDPRQLVEARLRWCGAVGSAQR
eukprot:6567511-Prymnesium_polylepis.2